MKIFAFPFGMAELHSIESTFPIEPPHNVSVLYTSVGGESAVFVDNTIDAYCLLEGDLWFGLAAFTFCVKNRTHYRDYFIHDLRLSMRPSGVYADEYQSLTEQLNTISERGKAKVIVARIRSLFEARLITSLIKPLLPSADLVEIMGAWQLQEQLFELGFRPSANSYKWGDVYGS